MNEKDTRIRFENFMEVLVREVLEDLLKVETLKVCRCDRCLLDIQAIALNALPSKYTVTERGELFAKLAIFRNQMRVDVLHEVLKAMELVGTNPSHKAGKPVQLSPDNVEEIKHLKGLTGTR